MLSMNGPALPIYILLTRTKLISNVPKYMGQNSPTPADWRHSSFRVLIASCSGMLRLWSVIKAELPQLRRVRSDVKVHKLVVLSWGLRLTMG